MAVGWCFAPLLRDPAPPDGQPARRHAFELLGTPSYETLIFADGGGYAFRETLGGQTVTKVRASAATLQTIAADPQIQRIPLSLLTDPVSSLTSAQQTAIQNKLLALGYTAAELNAAFPLGWSGPYTLADVARFALTRRFRPRYDQPTDMIILDGPQDPTGTPEQIDASA